MENSIQGPTRPATRIGYLPSLDGWRAVAVLGVLLTHDRTITLWGHSDAAWKGFGGFGVELFFAISGFLITTRILEEESLVGRFDVRRFYIRRLCRIQPASFVYLAVIALLMLTSVIRPDWRYWWGGLLGYQNYLFHQPHPSILGHFWSLAVEEHFYILLSVTLLVVRRARALALALMLAASVAWTIGPIARRLAVDAEATPRATQWMIHYLLWASLLAVLLRHEHVARFARRWLTPVVGFLATAVAALVHQMLLNHHRHRALLTEDWPDLWWYVASWSFALWVVATVLHPRSLTTRFLELKPLRFLGRLSYSLYLWHAVFFYGEDMLIRPVGWMSLLNARPMRYIASLAAAALSYYFVEKPLIRLGHRIAPPATPGHRDLADLPVEAPQPGHRAEGQLVVSS